MPCFVIRDRHNIPSNVGLLSMALGVRCCIPFSWIACCSWDINGVTYKRLCISPWCAKLQLYSPPINSSTTSMLSFRLLVIFQVLGQIVAHSLPDGFVSTIIRRDPSKIVESSSLIISDQGKLNTLAKM